MRIDVVPIRVGSTWILVRADVIEEFLSSTPWLPVPGATPLVPGVMSWRGRAIPVIDLQRVLSLGVMGPADERGRVMVVKHSLGAAAIPISVAKEVRGIDGGDIRSQHLTAIPHSGGEVEVGDDVLPLLEIERLLLEVVRSGGN